jgi:hypothetical protein
MNRIIIALFALLAVTFIGATSGHGCGTHEPPRGYVDSHGRTAETCFTNNPCDNPATRDSYIKTSDSAMIKLRVNSIYFGSLSDPTAKLNYDQNMEFFVRKYREQLGIEVIINTTEVTTEYQVVDASDDGKPTRLAMAQKYYQEGWMTAMYTNFDPNPETLLGYASQFPTELPKSLADWYTIMDIHGLNAGGTTVHHEVGHMLGLFHVFIQGCDACAEGVESPDRNIVGDLINDTLPMQNESNCNGTLAKPTDCNEGDLTAYEYADLPLNNYMAYTDDSCQTLGFTAQQSGRARCYLSTMLTFLSNEAPQPSPQSAPQANPNSNPNVTPTTTVSSATQVTAVASALFAALILAF